eukprot:scaffold28619_cov21-Tisochrysis_lutea.AAC.2
MRTLLFLHTFSVLASICLPRADVEFCQAVLPSSVYQRGGCGLRLYRCVLQFVTLFTAITMFLLLLPILQEEVDLVDMHAAAKIREPWGLWPHQRLGDISEDLPAAVPAFQSILDCSYV